MSKTGKITTKTPETKREDSISKAKRTDFSQSANSPVDHILHLQRTIGNQAVQKLFKSGVIQAKFRIGQPNDIYEQEADRVADEVMRMPENADVSGQVSAVRANSASFMQRQTIEETLDEEEELFSPGYDKKEPEELTPILESVPTRDAGGLGEEEELTPKWDRAQVYG